MSSYWELLVTALVTVLILGVMELVFDVQLFALPILGGY